jgi:hypothetical protein
MTTIGVFRVAAGERAGREPITHEQRILDGSCVFTWRMLSSATEAMTQSSVGFQAKSETFDVWPPWMNSSSGGPSSASSGVCRSAGNTL